MREQTKEIMLALKRLKRAKQAYKDNDQGLIGVELDMLGAIQGINGQLMSIEDDD